MAPSAFAHAIAHAEGFGVDGAIPTRANNPGDLVLGNVGYGTLGSEGITIFRDAEAGWAALEAELDRIRNERPARHRLPISHVYTLAMTIEQMAKHWTSTERDAWALNVAGYCAAHGQPSVTIETPIQELL